MSITFSLFENKMNPANKFWSARVDAAGSIDLDALANEIVNMGTTVRKADVLAVLENACQAIESNLIKGFRITMGGVVDIYTSISGKFDGPNDAFDPARNAVEVCANAGSRVRKAVRESASVEKQDLPFRLPKPTEYIDNETGTTNDQVTSGGIGEVQGSFLHYDDTQADEGIFFVSSGGTATKVTSVQTNSPSKLIFLVPTLGEVTYTLEVRARMNKTEGVKTGTLPYTLTAQPVMAKSSSGNGGTKKTASASTTTNRTKKRGAVSASTSTNGGSRRKKALAKA